MSLKYSPAQRRCLLKLSVWLLSGKESQIRQKLDSATELKTQATDALRRHMTAFCEEALALKRDLKQIASDEASMRADFDDLILEVNELTRLGQPAAVELARRTSLWASLEALINNRNQKRDRLARARDIARFLLALVRSAGTGHAQDTCIDIMSSEDEDNVVAELNDDEILAIENSCDEATRFAVEALRRAVNREQIIRQHLDDQLEIREETLAKIKMLDAYLAAHPSACDVPIAVEPISISPSDSQSINAAAAFQPSSNPFTSALLSGDYSFPAKSSEPSQFAASPTRTPALPAASTSPESLNSLNQYGSASVWLSSSTDSILQQLKALNLEDELHDLVAEFSSAEKALEYLARKLRSSGLVRERRHACHTYSKVVVEAEFITYCCKSGILSSQTDRADGVVLGQLLRMHHLMENVVHPDRDFGDFYDEFDRFTDDVSGMEQSVLKCGVLLKLGRRRDVRDRWIEFHTESMQLFIHHSKEVAARHSPRDHAMKFDLSTALAVRPTSVPYLSVSGAVYWFECVMPNDVVFLGARSARERDDWLQTIQLAKCQCGKHEFCPSSSPQQPSVHASPEAASPSLIQSSDAIPISTTPVTSRLSFGSMSPAPTPFMPSVSIGSFSESTSRKSASQSMSEDFEAPHSVNSRSLRDIVAAFKASMSQHRISWAQDFTALILEDDVDAMPFFKSTLDAYLRWKECRGANDGEISEAPVLSFDAIDELTLSDRLRSDSVHSSDEDEQVAEPEQPVQPDSLASKAVEMISSFVASIASPSATRSRAASAAPPMTTSQSRSRRAMTATEQPAGFLSQLSNALSSRLSTPKFNPFASPLIRSSMAPQLLSLDDALTDLRASKLESSDADLAALRPDLGSMTLDDDTEDSNPSALPDSTQIDSALALPETPSVELASESTSESHEPCENPAALPESSAPDSIPRLRPRQPSISLQSPTWKTAPTPQPTPVAQVSAQPAVPSNSAAASAKKMHFQSDDSTSTASQPHSPSSRPMAAPFLEPLPLDPIDCSTKALERHLLAHVLHMLDDRTNSVGALSHRFCTSFIDCCRIFGAVRGLKFSRALTCASGIHVLELEALSDSDWSEFVDVALQCVVAEVHSFNNRGLKYLLSVIPESESDVALAPLLLQALSVRMFRDLHDSIFPLYCHWAAVADAELEVRRKALLDVSTWEFGISPPLCLGEPRVSAASALSRHSVDLTLSPSMSPLPSARSVSSPKLNPISPRLNAYAAAVAEYNRMSHRSSPIEKLQQFVRISRSICACVDRHHRSQELPNKDDSVIGADDLLLLFALLVVRGDCSHLHAELKFIEDMLSEQQRSAAAALYYHATFQAAAELLRTIDKEEIIRPHI